MILPKIGELNRRIRMYSKKHTPNAKTASLDASQGLIGEVWAKVEIIGGVSYFESVNLEEKVTHRFYVRYVPGMRPQDLRHLLEINCEGVWYRAKRCTDLNGAHRFTLIECEELGNGSVL